MAPLGWFPLTALLVLLGSALPAAAAEPASAAKAAPAETRPEPREAAIPRRTSVIVLPSVDALRAAARAEKPQAAARTADVPLLPPAPVDLPAAASLIRPATLPPTPPPVFEEPPPDPHSPDPLERLRARLKERLAAVKPPDANSPYELQVSTRAVAGAAAKRPVASSGSPKARPRQPPAAALPESEWAYEGEHGPASWGGLCATGKRQSPIDIREGLPVALEPIGFHYQSGSFSVLDTGRTVQVNVAPGNFAQLGDQRFELKQFHFHRPSEETLDGRRFDLSVHLVHRDARGRRLIVAVLVQQGSAQPVLRSVFGNLPLDDQQENHARITLNPADLLPGEQAYYTYMGSLTMPPCSEDVQWVVLRHPVAASADQIELFGRLYTDNIRPLQQAEGRRILQTP